MHDPNLLQNQEVSEGAEIIFQNINAAISAGEEGESPNRAQKRVDSAIDAMLKGEQGPEAQRLVLDASIGFSRLELYGSAAEGIVQGNERMESTIFYSSESSTSGSRRHILQETRLADQLNGQHGQLSSIIEDYRGMRRVLNEQFTAEPEEGKVKYMRRHLDDLEVESQSAINSYGRLVNSEVGRIPRYVNSQVQGTLDAMADLNHRVSKQEAARQKLADGHELSEEDLQVSKNYKFAAFMTEASQVESTEAFGERLQAVIDRCPDKDVAHKLMAELSDAGNITSNEVEHLVRDLNADMEKASKNSIQTIKETSSLMTPNNLPYELPISTISQLLEALPTYTLRGIRPYTSRWVYEVGRTASELRMACGQ